MTYPYAPAQTPRRSPWTVVAVLMVALAVVIAGAIGVGAYVVLHRGARPTTAPTAPADGGSYGSAADLIAALGRAGVPCTGYEPVEAPTGGAIERGSCDIGADGVVVSIYESDAAALAAPQTLGQLNAGLIDTDITLGQNWTVNCDGQAMARRIAGAIGGRVVHVPK